MLTNKDIDKLSRRLGRKNNVSPQDIARSTLPENDLRAIFKAASKNSRKKIGIAIISLYSAFAIYAGGDSLQRLAEMPLIDSAIQTTKADPRTASLGNLYETVLTSPDTSFYVKILLGIQLAGMAAYLPVINRRQEKLASQILANQPHHPK